MKRAIPYAIFAGALLTGSLGGFSHWRRNSPEWYYYRQLVYLPLADVTGPDKPIFGYLPGCKALLAPFILAEPVGYIVFALLNALSCIGIYCITYRQYSDAETSPLPPRLSLLWLSICSAVPTWFALQNNQIVAPSVFLSLFAFSLLARRRDLLAGGVLAIAVLLKTLPLFLFPLLCRRWRSVLMAGTSVCVISIGLACITEGFDEGVRSHIRWPSQAVAQNPMRALAHDGEPRSFDSNQSPAAEIVRLARSTGINQLVWLHATILLTSLFVLMTYTFRPDSERLFWLKGAGWLAWVAYAAPFGRYYYLLFLVPALYVLGLRALAYSGERYYTCLSLVTSLSILLLGARSHNPLYALASFTALLLLLIVLGHEETIFRQITGSDR